MDRKKKFKFDVVIGNPPYQEDTNGAGRQAKPMYNLFMDEARKINPEYISYIMPSRWFAGGMGLNQFRDSMMTDKHLTKIVDFTNAKDCFPNISIGGGVSYFIWDKNHNGECNFTNITNGKVNSMIRPLDEFPVLVRYNSAIDIIRKVFSKNNVLLDEKISSLMPFGLNTSYRGQKEKSDNSQLRLYSSNDITYINRNEILKGHEWVDKYKIMISKTSAEHAGEPGKDGKFRVIPSSMQVLVPGEVVTHSYFMIGPFDDKITANNALSYLKTNFVRFLMLLSVSGFGLSKLVFNFVPMEDFNQSWDDEKLYKKYNLDDEHIAFINSMIKPMADNK